MSRLAENLMDKTSQGFARNIVAELAEIRRLINDAISPPIERSQGTWSHQREANGNQSQHWTITDAALPSLKTLELQPGGSAKIAAKGTDHNPDRAFQRLRKYKPVINVVTLAVLGIYTSVTVLLWVSSRSENSISRDSIRLSQRPWVGLTDEGPPVGADPLVINGEGNAIETFVLNPKNFSGGAAQHIQVQARLILTANYSNVVAYQASVCRDELVGDISEGFILFPGKYKVSTATVAVYEHSQWEARGERGLLKAYMVSCIGYRDQFMHLYRSHFIYALTNQGGGNGPIGGQITFRPVPNSTILGRFTYMQSGLD